MQDNKNTNSTIDEKEIAHFSNYANEWWDQSGEFKVLHKINPARIEFIKSCIEPKGLNILDIGCGGGLLCEPLTRLGANVTGIDASSENIEIAKVHAIDHGLTINYINGAAEDLSQKYDVVCALEVIEHVSSPRQFLNVCCNLVKPGGLLFISTLNRTMKAYLLGVLLAENVLKWAPKGTHNWKKFVRPNEIRRWLSDEFTVNKINGIDYSIIQDEWKLTPEADINYIMCIGRKG